MICGTYSKDNQNQIAVGNENNEKRSDSVYSKRIKAGKRRTYFFDIKATKSNDYFLTITESRKRFDDDGYDRHKIFLYKEDFNKFVKGLSEAVDFVKTDLMPDFDFDAFSHEYQEPDENNGIDSKVSGARSGNIIHISQGENRHVVTPIQATDNNGAGAEVDAW